MEIEQLLEHVIAWLDKLLSDPNSASVIDNALTAFDDWLKADLANKSQAGQSRTAQSVTPGDLPRGLRAKQSSMTDVRE